MTDRISVSNGSQVITLDHRPQGHWATGPPGHRATGPQGHRATAQHVPALRRLGSGGSQNGAGLGKHTGEGGAQREKDADEQRDHEDPGLRALHHLDKVLRSRPRCERSSAGAAGTTESGRTIWSSERLTTLRDRVKKPLFQVIRSSLLSICRLLPSPSHSLHSTGEPPSSAARRQRRCRRVRLTNRTRRRTGCPPRWCTLV